MVNPPENGQKEEDSFGPATNVCSNPEQNMPLVFHISTDLGLLLLTISKCHFKEQSPSVCPSKRRLLFTANERELLFDLIFVSQIVPYVPNNFGVPPNSSVPLSSAGGAEQFCCSVILQQPTRGHPVPKDAETNSPRRCPLPASDCAPNLGAYWENRNRDCLPGSGK